MTLTASKTYVVVDDGLDAPFTGVVHRFTQDKLLGVFLENECRDLGLRQSVKLDISMPELALIQGVPAKVALRSDHSPLRCYGFSFPTPLNERELPEEPAQDRRSALRVSLEDEDMSFSVLIPEEIARLAPRLPDGLEFRNGFLRVPSTARDLSEDGLSMHVPMSEAIVLTVTDRVTLILSVPVEQVSLSVEGRIRHRRDGAGRATFGVQFDWDRTEYADGKKGLIRDYLRFCREKPRS